ncbi:uncharacterized protein LOC116029878 [Ipomoea triloba]|uniref:uncharacterized protein LOC116029878 n=1 Tax=Ipomoea triloba TaxID=35885 RepID=UPI00125DD244|nr:uncharacterized protein LOC116029878 [Ipomoea triloba]
MGSLTGHRVEVWEKRPEIESHQRQCGSNLSKYFVGPGVGDSTFWEKCNILEQVRYETSEKKKRSPLRLHRRRTRCSDSIAAAPATQTPSAFSLQLYHHTSINFVAHNRAWSKEVFAHSSAHCLHLRSRSSPSPVLIAVCLFSVIFDIVAISRQLCLICYREYKQHKRGIKAAENGLSTVVSFGALAQAGGGELRRWSSDLGFVLTCNQFLKTTGVWCDRMWPGGWTTVTE